ncbi:MAG: polysaccharide deacetylase family protein, partial [Verrucomicrobia bacterium]|nr:polysaccharide deacetylase family protein [Verrucomicrobiota bacterium]
LDNGLPVLDEHGVRATFYVSFSPFDERLDEWKTVQARGHEIGNHTVTHPCTGNWSFVRQTGNALEDYTALQICAELDDANERITAAMGTRPETFAYPCGNTFIGRGRQRQSYVPFVAERFLVGRGYGCEGSASPAHCDLAHVPGRSADGLAFSQLRAMIEICRDRGDWLALCLHDVGNHREQAIQARVLDQLCAYANDAANGIWVDTIAAIGRYVRDKRKDV